MRAGRLSQLHDVTLVLRHPMSFGRRANAPFHAIEVVRMLG